jgi:hypothetical protein
LFADKSCATAAVFTALLSLGVGSLVPIFKDGGVSGANTGRPGLNAAVSSLLDGGALLVYVPGRHGPSITHVLEKAIDSEGRGMVLEAEAVVSGFQDVVAVRKAVE